MSKPVSVEFTNGEVREYELEEIEVNDYGVAEIRENDYHLIPWHSVRSVTQEK